MDLDSAASLPVEMWHRPFLAQTHGIIDPLQVAAAQFSDLPVEPLNPPLLGRCLYAPPLLHTLSREDRLALLERCNAQQRDRGRPLFCTLLESDAPGRLGLHLMNQMAPLQPSVGRVLFRVHDPRVFRLLRWLLDASQMAQLLGPISSWTWHEPLGNTWRTQHRPVVEAPPGRPIRADQWPILAQCSCINGCLRDLCEQGAGHASAQLPALLAGLDEGGAVGLRNAADLQCYALQRLENGEDFAQQVVVKRRFERVQQQGMSYRMACQLEQRPSPTTEAA
ncbi:hypothetical protein [uncultured Stenotrophomonas sp.]|uniref:hypothetical protein n=1 Tax=uncultured Stenotrophomonas sp. TaxID=165438 RepID=UPI0025F5B7C0|nr:hypothetical protein [uncultured Stenotrophomonas sp.]